MISNKKILYLIMYVAIFVMTSYICAHANEVSKSPKIERHLVFDTIPLNLEEIAAFSGKIFSGECTNVEEIENDLESNLPVVQYTYEVIDGIKNVNNGETITFKQWDATTNGTGYEVGEKYVLFLYPESKIGLTSPVGFLQGRFDIETKGFLRKDVVRNKSNNLGLSRNLKTQKKIELEDGYLNNYLHKCSELGIPMRYKEFIKVVKVLVENNQ